MSVTGTVVSVGCGLICQDQSYDTLYAVAYEIVVLGSVFLEQRIGSEIGGVTTSGEDDSTHLSVLMIS